MRARLFLALSVGIAFSFGGIGFSSADGGTGSPSGTGTGKPRGPEHLIQRFDKNNNNALEASEVPERMWAHLSVADTNKDGVITADELKAAHAAGKLGWHHKGGEEANPSPAPSQGK